MDLKANPSKDLYTPKLVRANDALTVVNDWQLQLFKNGEAATSIFAAVGNQATAIVVPCEGSIIECNNASVY